MKSLLYLVTALILLLSSCKPKQQSQGSPETPTAIPVKVHTDNKYIHLSGKIDGKYEVTMDLILRGDDAFAYYSYNAVMQPMSISGSYRNDSLTLSGGGNMTDTLEELFKGTFIDGNYIGQWSKGKKKMPFELKIANANVPFEVIEFKDSSSRFADKPNAPQVKFSSSLLTTTNVKYDDLFLLINNFYFKGKVKSIGSVNDNLKEQAADFFSGYHEQLNNRIDDTTMNWASYYEESNSAEVVYNTEYMLVLELNYYEYSGGAHGMYGRSFLSINMVDRSVVKLEDFFDAADTLKLQELLIKNVRQVRNIPANESLEESGLFVKGNNLPIPRNYYITPGGVMFKYSLYEITSYVEGEVSFFIPFTEMKGFIKRQNWMKK